MPEDERVDRERKPGAKQMNGSRERMKTQSEFTELCNPVGQNRELRMQKRKNKVHVG